MNCENNISSLCLDSQLWEYRIEFIDESPDENIKQWKDEVKKIIMKYSDKKHLNMNTKEMTLEGLWFAFGKQFLILTILFTQKSKSELEKFMAISNCKAYLEKIKNIIRSNMQ